MRQLYALIAVLVLLALPATAQITIDMGDLNTSTWRVTSDGSKSRWYPPPDLPPNTDTWETVNVSDYMDGDCTTVDDGNEDCACVKSAIAQANDDPGRTTSLGTARWLHPIATSSTEGRAHPQRT